jgi:hypothetical protein
MRGVFQTKVLENYGRVVRFGHYEEALMETNRAKACGVLTNAVTESQRDAAGANKYGFRFGERAIDTTVCGRQSRPTVIGKRNFFAAGGETSLILQPAGRIVVFIRT